MYQDNKKKLFILLLLFTAGIFAGVLTLRERLVKPKAAPGVPKLAFASSLTPLAVGKPFDLIVRANPNGGTFNAFELHFTFDPEKIELAAADNISGNITKLFSSALNLTTSLSGNTLAITGAKTGDPFSGDSDIDLVKVAMKVKTAATESAFFNWDKKTEIEGKIPEAINAKFDIAGELSPAKLYFSSAKTGYKKGENVDLELYLDTGGKEVSSLQFEFRYRNPDTYPFFLDPKETDIILDPVSGFDVNNPLNSVDTADGKIIVGLVAASSPVTGIRKLATVKLTINPSALYNLMEITPLTSSRVYDAKTQNILGQRESYKITLSDVDFGTPTPTGVFVSPTVTPAPTPACPVAFQSCQTSKGRGDADCDGRITQCDFTLWKNAFIGPPAGLADFNEDSNIDLSDYEIWRRNFYGSPFATVSPSVISLTEEPVPSPIIEPTGIVEITNFPVASKVPAGGSCPKTQGYFCTSKSKCTTIGAVASGYTCTDTANVCCRYDPSIKDGFGQ